MLSFIYQLRHTGSSAGYIDFVKEFLYFFYSYCSFSRLLEILLSAVGEKSMKNLEIRLEVNASFQGSMGPNSGEDYLRGYTLL